MKRLLVVLGLAGVGWGPLASAFAEPMNVTSRKAAIEAAATYQAVRLQTLLELEAREHAMEAAVASARQPLPSAVIPLAPRRPMNRRTAIANAMRFARYRLRGAPSRRIAWARFVPARPRFLDLGIRAASVEVALETARQRITTAEGQDSRFNSTQLQERLALRQTGSSLYDPRLFTFSLGGEFGLSPDWSEWDGGRAVRRGTLWGYDTVANLLPQAATSLDLFAMRQHDLLSRELATLSESVNEQRGMTLSARRLPIPSTLTVQRELQEEESHTGDVAIQREDWRTIMTYEGQRGWLNRELNLRAELIDLSAVATPSLSYQSREGVLRYGADSGPELNRHWESTLRAFSRTGNTQLSTLTVDEAIQVDHRDTLWSDYHYLLNANETSGRRSTSQNLGARLHHRLYDSLTTTVGGDLLRQALTGGTEHVLRSQADVDYLKQLPWHGRLRAGMGTTMAYQQDRFEGTESFVPQEVHDVASPVALPITVDHASATSSSLVVTKIALGPLPIGCIAPSGPPVPLVLGRDYTLLTVNNFLQIIPIACSGASPGINPGDTLGVEYDFRVSPSVDFTTNGWRANLNLEYPWIRPYLAHEQTMQSLLSGQDDGRLEDQRSQAVGLEVGGQMPRLQVNLLGELSRYTAERTAYDRARSTQWLSCAIRPEVTLSLSAEQSFFNFLEPAHQATHFLEQGTLTYAPGPGLLIDVSASRRAVTDTLLPNERNLEVGLNLRWFIRKLEVLPVLRWFTWQRGGTRAREYRVFLRAVRRF